MDRAAKLEQVHMSSCWSLVARKTVDVNSLELLLKWEAIWNSLTMLLSSLSLFIHLARSDGRESHFHCPSTECREKGQSNTEQIYPLSGGRILSKFTFNSHHPYPTSQPLMHRRPLAVMCLKHLWFWINRRGSQPNTSYPQEPWWLWDSCWLRPMQVSGWEIHGIYP